MVTELTRKISQSRKYKDLYNKTIQRIVEDSLRKGGVKQTEKLARRKLHQMWGAYWSTRPDFNKLLERFGQDIKQGKDLKQAATSILSLQSSTKERISILDSFYQKIFAITGMPSTIIDLACGLNPLTYFWMDLPKSAQYQGFDIDRGQVDFLNQVFQVSGIQKRVKISLGDVLIDEFEYADVVFMLKLLPLLEHQQKGISLELMKKQPCKNLVVSFPVRSLGGKSKGMIVHYERWFKNLIKDEKREIKKILLETELIFIIHK